MNEMRHLAVITGASSGIGYELARTFAENDFDILICAEDAEIEAAAGSLESTGVTVSHQRVDLSDHRELRTSTTGSRPPSVLSTRSHSTRASGRAGTSRATSIWPRN